MRISLLFSMADCRYAYKKIHLQEILPRKQNPNAYLTNSSQCVKNNQNISSSLPVTSGVPHGIVLGALSFIIFFNDMADDVANRCSYLFADNLENFSNSSVSLLPEDINSIFIGVFYLVSLSIHQNVKLLILVGVMTLLNFL